MSNLLPFEVKQGNPACIADCPVIGEDRSAVRAFSNNMQAQADYERHCQESADCSGVEFRAAHHGGAVVFCARFGVELPLDK